MRRREPHRPSDPSAGDPAVPPIAFIEEEGGRLLMLVIEHREPVVAWSPVGTSAWLGSSVSGRVVAVTAFGEMPSTARLVLLEVLNRHAVAIEASFAQLLRSE